MAYLCTSIKLIVVQLMITNVYRFWVMYIIFIVTNLLIPVTSSSYYSIILQMHLSFQGRNLLLASFDYIARLLFFLDSLRHRQLLNVGAIQ